jgi:hypothetical protein
LNIRYYFRNKNMSQNPCTQKKLCYIQPPVRQPIRHHPSYERPDTPIDNATVYRNSYLDFDAETMAKCRLPATKSTAVLGMNITCPMDAKTTHSLSYLGETTPKRPPIIPLQRIGCHGPIQDVTTSRHDFVSKYGQKPPKIYPRDHLVASTASLSNDTTTRLSYPGHTDIEIRPSFKPLVTFQQPDNPFDTGTTQKLSYLPLNVTKREIPPWAVRPLFTYPNGKIDDSTTQKMSYLLPGTFAENDNGNDDRALGDEYEGYPKAGL